jgi:nucleosome assembly protein 1-like 1
MTESEENRTDDDNSPEATPSSETKNDGEQTFVEKVQAEMEKAKDMKIGELKMKLMSKGVLTSTFCEKSEFVRAYAEAMVKEAEHVVETVEDDEGWDPRLPALARNLGGEGDDDSEQDVMAQLPLYVKHRVDKLKELHEEREKTLKEYSVERAKLEAKYHELTKPLYGKRADIILGKMDEDIAKEHEGKGEDGDNEKDGGEGQEEKVKGIPQFWVCALGHMDVVAGLITEQDVDCLEHLQDITCVNDENGEGFTLNFHFAPNDYFENAILTKKYEVPNLLLGDEPILKNVEGCEINWKPGRSMTHREVSKTQRGKGKNAGQLRSVKKKEKSESFFHFFTPPKMPSFDSMDEEEADRLETAFDEDYDIAQAFRSHIIPKAVLWFTGQVSVPDAAGLLNFISNYTFAHRVFLYNRLWNKRWKQPWAICNGLVPMEMHQPVVVRIPNASRANGVVEKSNQSTRCACLCKDCIRKLTMILQSKLSSERIVMPSSFV